MKDPCKFAVVAAPVASAREVVVAAPKVEGNPSKKKNLMRIWVFSLY